MKNEQRTTNNEQLILRNSRPEDLAQVVAIYNSTIPTRQATADLTPFQPEERRAWFEKHSPERRPLWVLCPKEAEEEVWAWVSFADYKERAAYNITAEISIYIREDKRGQGYGRLLLREALDSAPGLGIRNLMGVIFGHNALSLALFRSEGFKDWGLLPEVTEMDGKLYDVVILGRKVGEGN